MRTDVIVRSSVPKGHCPRSLQLFLDCYLRRSVTMVKTMTMMTAGGGAGHGFCCCCRRRRRGVAPSNLAEK